MKKRTRRLLISLVLTLVMLAQSVGTVAIYAEESVETQEEYEYTIPEELISKEHIELYGHKERFFKAEQAMNEIHLLNEDGTVSAYMFDFPVKYVDEDGVIKDKSNKLYESKRNNYLYVNDDNDIKTYFPKKITKKPVIIEADGFSIEIGIVTDSRYSKKGELIEGNRVFYNQAFGENTAIQYQADFNGYKEEIILYNSDAPTEYSFEIECKGLEAVKDNGTLRFISKESGLEIFKLDPFYIYDSSETEKSYIDTEYSVTKIADEKYIMTVSLREDYLSLEGLTYPIYVDPGVKYNTTSYIDDAPIYSGTPTTNYGTAIVGYLGKHSTYGTGRMVLRFPQLKQAGSLFQSLTDDEIMKVKLYVYSQAYGTTNSTVRAHQFEGSSTWTESGVTWNNAPADSYGTLKATGILSATSNVYYPYDITNIAKTWKPNTTEANTLFNQGIILKNNDESNESKAKCVRTLNFGSSSAPYILVNYTKTLPDGVYYIKNAATQMYMELESASSAEEVPIQQNVSDNTRRQWWEIKKRPDGFYTIKNMYSGLYAGVQNKSSINGASIVQYADYDDYIEDKSKWSFGISTSGNYILSPTSSHTEGRVLAVPNSTSGAGANLIQYSYVDDSNYTDEWTIEQDTITYVNYYDYSFTDSILLSYIEQAVQFCNVVFSKYFPLHFQMEDAPEFVTLYSCPNGEEGCNNSTCGNRCSVTHHKNIVQIELSLLSCAGGSQNISEDELHVLWSNHPIGYYCEDKGNGHTEAEYYGLTYDGSSVIEILRLFGTTYEQRLANMALLLAHETAHTLGMSEAYNSNDIYNGEHIGAKHSKEYIDCIMTGCVEHQTAEIDFYNRVLSGGDSICEWCLNELINDILLG